MQLNHVICDYLFKKFKIKDAVDTSGAGDAFFSTVIREYAYCEKIDKDFIDKTFELANKSSRDIIAQVGSRK